MVGNINDMVGSVITDPKAKDALMKVLISPQDGFEGYVMRVVEVQENGFTPKHSHPWPHINYMIEGDGELLINDTVNQVSSGSYAFVPQDALHQFRNTGKGTFKFICIVPEVGHKY